MGGGIVLPDRPVPALAYHPIALNQHRTDRHLPAVRPGQPDPRRSPGEPDPGRDVRRRVDLRDADPALIRKKFSASTFQLVSQTCVSRKHST